MAIPFWLQNVIGSGVRGALVGAANPMPPGANAAARILGGMQAAEADQNQQFDRMELMRRARIQEMRQAEEDERRRTEHEAMLRYRHAQEMSEQAQMERANRPKEDPEEERLYKFYFDKAKAAGVDNEMAHRQAMAGIGRNTTGWMPPVKSEPPAPVFKNPEEYLTNKYAQEMEALDKQPELDPTFDRGRYLQSEMQKLAVPQARAATAGRPFKGADGRMYVMKDGQAELLETGKPQPKAGKAPRVQIIQDEAGNYHGVEAKPGPTGVKGKPKSGSAKDDLLKAMAARKSGQGGSAAAAAPTKVASRTDIAAYAAQAGVSEAEAQKAFIAKGYTIR